MSAGSATSPVTATDPKNAHVVVSGGSDATGASVGAVVGAVSAAAGAVVVWDPDVVAQAAVRTAAATASMRGREITTRWYSAGRSTVLSLGEQLQRDCFGDGTLFQVVEVEALVGAVGAADVIGDAGEQDRGIGISF